jgi:hypothetical protein
MKKPQRIEQDLRHYFLQCPGVNRVEIRLSNGEWRVLGTLEAVRSEPIDDALALRIDEIFEEAEELWQWMNGEKK